MVSQKCDRVKDKLFLKKLKLLSHFFFQKLVIVKPAPHHLRHIGCPDQRMTE